MSTFSGINAAVTALRAHRGAMDVIGQNVANVNTVGYTRQRVELTQLYAPGGSGMLTGAPVAGGGVAISGITRAFDSVQANRVNVQTADHALQQSRAQTLSSLESLAQEPSDAGLATQLNAMWAAWADAATKVGATNADSAARQSVLGASRNVATTLNASWNTVDQQWSTVSAQVQADVVEVNSLASSVAVLNEQIQKAMTTGGSPNELMDKRDLLVTRVVELTGATVQAGANGQTDLYLGGGLLVQGNLTATFAVKTPLSMTDVVDGQAAAAKLRDPEHDPAEDEDLLARVAAGSFRVTVGSNSVTPYSGQITGSLEALTTTLPDAARSYDEIADRVATLVNASQLSEDGADLNGSASSVALFTGSAGGAFGARDLAVNGAIRGSDLALGLQGRGARDGSNAAAIAKIGTSTNIPDPMDPDRLLQSPDSLWSDRVAKLGAASASAESRTVAAQAVLTASVADMQGSAGVSLDEESADLIAAQRAYQGAARVLTAVDEMLDTLINKTGLVGR